METLTLEAIVVKQNFSGWYHEIDLRDYRAGVRKGWESSLVYEDHEYKCFRLVEVLLSPIIVDGITYAHGGKVFRVTENGRSSAGTIYTEKLELVGKKLFAPLMDCEWSYFQREGLNLGWRTSQLIEEGKATPIKKWLATPDRLKGDKWDCRLA